MLANRTEAPADTNDKILRNYLEKFLKDNKNKLYYQQFDTVPEIITKLLQDKNKQETLSPETLAALNNVKNYLMDCIFNIIRRSGMEGTPLLNALYAIGDYNVTDKEGRTMLIRLSSCKDLTTGSGELGDYKDFSNRTLEAIKTLLKQSSVDTNATTPEGYSALSVALKNGARRAADALVEQSATLPNDATLLKYLQEFLTVNKDNLYYQQSNVVPKVISKLLHNENLRKLFSDDTLAALNDVKDYLMDCLFNIIRRSGMTLRSESGIKENSLLDALYALGGYNTTDKQGSTLLMRLSSCKAMTGSSELGDYKGFNDRTMKAINTLIDRGHADVNVTTPKGRSALSFALTNDFKEAADKLTLCGATLFQQPKVKSKPKAVVAPTVALKA